MDNNILNKLYTKQYSAVIIPIENRDDTYCDCDNDDLLKELNEVLDYMIANDPKSEYTLLAAMNLCKYHFGRFEEDETKMLTSFIRNCIADRYNVPLGPRRNSSVLVNYFCAKPEVSLPLYFGSFLTHFFEQITELEDEPYPEDIMQWLELLNDAETDDERLIWESAKFLEHPNDNIAFLAAEAMASVYIKHRLWFCAGVLVETMRNKSIDFIQNSPRIPNAAHRLYKAMTIEMEIALAGAGLESLFPLYANFPIASGSDEYRSAIKFMDIYCSYLQGNIKEAQQQIEAVKNDFDKYGGFSSYNEMRLNRLGTIVHPTLFPYETEEKGCLYYEHLLSLAKEAYRAENYENAKELCLKIPLEEMGGELYCVFRADYYKLMADISKELGDDTEKDKYTDKYSENNKQAEDMQKNEESQHKKYVKKFSQRAKAVSLTTAMDFIIVAG